MSKKKLDIHGDIAKRKYHKANPFLYLIYYVVNRSRLLGAKYHPQYKVIDKIEKGPAFVIFNHLSRRDHCFVNALCWPRRMNMVAGYNEFCRKHLHFAFWGAQILPKKIFCNDLIGMRAMNSLLKQNGVVAFSPEGTSSIFGYNQAIAPGTGRYLKSYKTPIYYVEIDGAYLTNNKVTALTDRIGKVYASIRLLFSKEDLERMSGDEIQDKINEVFEHDDYAWNKKAHIEYKCKTSMTEGLSVICYRCPKCGELFVMEEGMDEIHCKKCGNKAKVDHFYNLIPEGNDSKFPELISKWSEWERELVIKEVRDPNFKFEYPCELGNLPNDRWVEPKNKTSMHCGDGKIVIDHLGFHYIGTMYGKDIKLDFSYQQLWTFSVATDPSTLSIFTPEEYYEFSNLGNRGAYILMCVEEMHRYHVNTWKNLPRYNYMYEGLELGIDNKK